MRERGRFDARARWTPALVVAMTTSAVMVLASAPPTAARLDAARSDTAPAVHWTLQTSGVTARLRGVSAVSETVAWASGTAGTIIRTTDGGRSWRRLTVPGTEALDFRDIDAFDARVAYVLSIGPGAASRIYKTMDGGAHWDLQFQNQDERVFLDAMAFWTPSRGLAVSDSVDGRFVLFRTTDAGRTWTRIADKSLPPALPGEGAFAASGTNVTVSGTRHAWIGTGAASEARVLRTADGGDSWMVSPTPLPAGPSSGIFSIAFRDTRHGIIVGGDYKQERAAVKNAATTTDGGRTWTLTGTPGLSGFRSVVSYVPGSSASTAIAVGPSGADRSVDDGRTWTPLESAGFHAFSLARRGGVGWAVGEEGRVASVPDEKFADNTAPRWRGFDRRSSSR